MEADGYSLDDKRTPIDKRGDILDIIERYKNRKTENPQDRKGKCFYVPFDEIKENNYDLSLSKYKEIKYEEIDYELFIDYETGEMKQGSQYFKQLSRTIIEYANHPESKFDGDIGIFEWKHVLAM